jgi:hypothetical protein
MIIISACPNGIERRTSRKEAIVRQGYNFLVSISIVLNVCFEIIIIGDYVKRNVNTV